jgi:hypothetical protein
VVIPPGIWTGFKGMSDVSIVANYSTHLHDPTNTERIDPFGDQIPAGGRRRTPVALGPAYLNGPTRQASTKCGCWAVFCPSLPKGFRRAVQPSSPTSCYARWRPEDSIRREMTEAQFAQIASRTPAAGASSKQRPRGT